MQGNNKKQKFGGKQAQDRRKEYHYLIYKFESAKGMKMMEFLIKLIKQYNKKHI